MPQDAAEDAKALRRQVHSLEARVHQAESAVRALAIVPTVLLLAVGQFMPFFVASNEFKESATLWTALGKDAPSVVADPGGGWFVPIAATWVVGAAMLVLLNVRDYRRKGAVVLRMVARTLSTCYLIGCLLGLMVLGAEVEGGPDTAAASPGMVMLTLGAAMAVFVSYSRLSDPDFGGVDKRLS